jgi:hypothetical protein
MAIVNAQLTTTALNIITVPVEKSYAITNILVCNTSLVSAASFDMHLIPFGETLSNAVTTVVRNLELPPGETFTFDSERIVLDQGDKITFVAEPSIGSGLTNLAATVSYLEV